MSASKAPSIPFPTGTPPLPVPGWAVCSDDRPGDRSPAVCAELSAGGGAGDLVRLSAAPAPPADSPQRRLVSGGGGLGLAGAGLPDLRRGSAAGVCRGSSPWGTALGGDPGQAPAAIVFRVLDALGASYGICYPSRKKNFEICEIFLCICEKMGYNKV